MDISGDAYFVERPRTIRDLWVAHPIEKRRPFRATKKIVLPAIDYENFIYDLLADREFLEVGHNICSREGLWTCLFITMRKSNEGILVIPRDGCYVGWAAFYSM